MQPVFGGRFVIIQKGNELAPRQAKGRIAGIGYASIGFVTVKYRPACTGLDQSLDRFPG
jgi:hypothetical protein